MPVEGLGDDRGVVGGGRRVLLDDPGALGDLDRLVPADRVEHADAAGDGQTSALTSFIIQSWWPAPSWLPASVVYFTQSAGLSRQ